MKSRFSMPMPCSPLRAPPASTQRRTSSSLACEDALQRARHAAVEREERVEVAVAGVEDVGDDEPVALGDRVHAGEDLGELGARHHAVVQVVVGRDLRNRAERGLASLPDQRALGVVGGHADRADVVRPGRRLHGTRLRLHGLGDAVDLDDQDRRGVGGVARVREVLRRHHDAVVHHLDRGGHDAGRDDGRDRGRAVLHRGEVEEHRPHGRRERREAHAHPGHDAQRALAPHHHAAQVVAGRLGSLAPEALQGPVGQHHVEREDVRRRDAVREAVRAARVRVHVAPDRRGLLRRGVGRVGEPARRERGREVEVEEPGLHPGEPVLGAHLEDPLHLRGDDDEGVADRGGGAGEPRPRSAGDDREAVRRRRRGRRSGCPRSCGGRPRARIRPPRARRHGCTACARGGRRAPRRRPARLPVRGVRRRRRPCGLA